MSQSLRWSVRIGLLIIVLGLGLRRVADRKRPLGFEVGLASATCSIEQMQFFSILRLRLESGERVTFGGGKFSHTVPLQEALDELSLIQRTGRRDVWLFDADGSLTVEDTAAFLSEVRSRLPGWSVRLITPKSRSACDHLIEIRAVPAA